MPGSIIATSGDRVESDGSGPMYASKEKAESNFSAIAVMPMFLIVLASASSRETLDNLVSRAEKAESKQFCHDHLRCEPSAQFQCRDPSLSMPHSKAYVSRAESTQFCCD